MVKSILPWLCYSNSAGKLCQEFLTLRTLYSYGCPVSCNVGQCAVIVLDNLAKMLEVLVSVSCIDDQKITLFRETIEICVIDSFAFLIRDDAVLRLVEIECLNIAGQHVLEELYHVRALNDESSHVGYIEE